MSAFLTLDSVSALTPDGKLLFHDLTFSVRADRIGLVGRNGSGKSTLLSIAAGLAEPASGHVMRAGTLGVLRQDWPEHWSLADALGVVEAMAVLARVLAGEGDEADFAAADWTLESRIEAALIETGLPGVPLDRAIATLSGGERTRVGIAHLLLEAPDLLLLDEPTNNLDRAGRDAIAALISGWRGGILLASHDRELLEAMDRIVELTPVGVRIVGGGWSAFVAVRDEERARAAAEEERAQATLRDTKRSAQAQLEAKVRREKAGRAFAAKGSEPKILLGAMAERAEISGGRARAQGERAIAEASLRASEARANVEVVAPLTISLPPSGIPSGARLLNIDAAEAEIAGRSLGPWSLKITGPERVSISGANGAGKTTLLKLATGVLAPSRGFVEHAEGRVAMLDQHVSLLDRNSSVLDNVRRICPDRSLEEAHAICARFAFRNRDALRLVETLSGGERMRAGLAATCAEPSAPWLLILDEPTNHLDLDSIEVLEQALRAYDGALLVVSHDAAFLKRIGIQRELAI